jgi:hypothetical protein
MDIYQRPVPLDEYLRSMLAKPTFISLIVITGDRGVCRPAEAEA